MPYQPHRDVPTPDNDTPIWRYMNFVKFISLLEGGTLHFSRSDLLGDPFEGSLLQNTSLRIVNVDHTGETGRHLARLSEVNSEMRSQMAASHQELRSSMYISCWYARRQDSAAMWSIYANGSDGIAIKSTVGRLKTALTTSPEIITIGMVQYVDFDVASDTLGNALLQFLRKRESFDHEHEIRAIVMKGWESHPPGLNLQVDLSALIEEIVIAPQAERWFADLVRRCAQRYQINVDPRYSPLADGPFWG